MKHGVYEMFTGEMQDKPEDFDLDKILERSSTITYDHTKSDIENTLASFSKATFVADEDHKVDINDENFWNKVLPSFQTAKR